MKHFFELFYRKVALLDADIRYAAVKRGVSGEKLHRIYLLLVAVEVATLVYAIRLLVHELQRVFQYIPPGMLL